MAKQFALMGVSFSLVCLVAELLTLGYGQKAYIGMRTPLGVKQVRGGSVGLTARGGAQDDGARNNKDGIDTRYLSSNDVRGIAGEAPRGWVDFGIIAGGIVGVLAILGGVASNARAEPTATESNTVSASKGAAPAASRPPRVVRLLQDSTGSKPRAPDKV